ncbi:hypothetical protein MMPV_006527 [Pyropia vietnamensis]
MAAPPGPLAFLSPAVSGGGGRRLVAATTTPAAGWSNHRRVPLGSPTLPPASIGCGGLRHRPPWPAVHPPLPTTRRRRWGTIDGGSGGCGSGVGVVSAARARHVPVRALAGGLGVAAASLPSLVRPDLLRVALGAVTQLLLTIGMGVVASRRGILTPPVLAALSRVVVSIFLPAVLFSNIVTSMASAPLASMASLSVAAAFQIALGMALALTLRPALRLRRSGGLASRAFLVLCAFGNSAALPLLFGAALFGGTPSSAAAYVSGVSFFLLGWSPLFWSIGYELLTSSPDAVTAAGSSSSNSGDGEGSGERKRGGGRLLRRILTPPVVASFVAMVVGAIPALRGLLIAPGGRGGAPLGLALAAAQSLGAGYAPTAVLVLAGSLGAPTSVTATAPATTPVPVGAGRGVAAAALSGGGGGSGGGPAPLATAVHFPVVRLALAIALVRLVFVPAVTLGALLVLKTAGVVLPPMVQLVILMEAIMPSAQNCVLMLHKEGQPDAAAAVSRVLLLVYLAAIVPVAVGLSIFLVVSGL